MKCAHYKKNALSSCAAGNPNKTNMLPDHVETGSTIRDGAVVYFEGVVLNLPPGATVNGTTTEAGVHLFSVGEFLDAVYERHFVFSLDEWRALIYATFTLDEHGEAADADLGSMLSVRYPRLGPPWRVNERKHAMTANGLRRLLAGLSGVAEDMRRAVGRVLLCCLTGDTSMVVRTPAPRRTERGPGRAAIAAAAETAREAKKPGREAKKAVALKRAAWKAGIKAEASEKAAKQKARDAKYTGTPRMQPVIARGAPRGINARIARADAKRAAKQKAREARVALEQAERAFAKTAAGVALATKRRAAKKAERASFR